MVLLLWTPPGSDPGAPTGSTHCSLDLNRYFTMWLPGFQIVNNQSLVHRLMHLTAPWSCSFPCEATVLTALVDWPQSIKSTVLSR